MMMHKAALVAFALAAFVCGQRVGTYTAEVHPKLSIQKCTSSGGCFTVSAAIVLDSDWRRLYSTTTNANCYSGTSWDASLCPDPVTCAQNCALDGVAYSDYGILTSGNALTLKFMTGSNVGSRVYLLSDDNHYEIFKPLNQEFSFDVNMAHLPCGINGALYLSQMATDGGMSAYPNNKAGAKYGTGYCDSQCPHDVKFINGEANLLGWSGDASNPNGGSGQYGTCCTEMDIWQANSEAAAFTPHPCSVNGQTRCQGTACGDGPDRNNGVCDKDGCDFNSFRLGDQSFLGPGLTVDTTRPFTVVTQFIAFDGTANGDLSAIRRLYVQDGKVIQNSETSVPGIDPTNSITSSFCTQQKIAFNEYNAFSAQGGLVGMGNALKAGMVLAISIADDPVANLLWLDSKYPTDADSTAPGVVRGVCSSASGDPNTLESQASSASVTFSNFKFGDIGSTYTGVASPNPPKSSSAVQSSYYSSRAPTQPTSKPVIGTFTSGRPSSSTTIPPSQPSRAPQSQWGQCGGIGWTGPTARQSPFTCHAINAVYSQCY